MEDWRQASRPWLRAACRKARESSTSGETQLRAERSSLIQTQQPLQSRGANIEIEVQLDVGGGPVPDDTPTTTANDPLAGIETMIPDLSPQEEEDTIIVQLNIQTRPMTSRRPLTAPHSPALAFTQSRNIAIPQREEWNDTIHISGQHQKRRASGTRDVLPTFMTCIMSFLVKAAPIETFEPKTYCEAVKSSWAPQWIPSMEDEFVSLQKNGTWKVVRRPVDRHVLRGKWVYKFRRGAQGEILR